MNTFAPSEKATENRGDADERTCRICGAEKERHQFCCYCMLPQAAVEFPPVFYRAQIAVAPLAQIRANQTNFNPSEQNQQPTTKENTHERAND